MNRIVCFVSDEMADFEVVLTLQLLKGRGRREIITAAVDTQPVVSQSGFTHQPNCTLAQALEMPGVEALIIPGGPIRPQPAGLSELIQKLDGEGRLLAAICFGPQYLGRAGALDHRRFTTSCSVDTIKSLQVPDPYPRQNYVNARVVRDGNIITANGSAFIDFAFAINDYLGVFADQPAERERLYREFMDR